MKNIVSMTGVLTFCFLLASCSSGKNAEEAIKAVGLTQDVIERSITLSFEGKMEVAVSLLLDGTESDATAVEIVDCLGMSEWDFRKLAVDPKLSQVQDRNGDVGRAARELARAAIQAAADARAQGEEEKATYWLQRVDAMGQQLASAKYNKLLGLQGDAIVRDAAKGPLS